VAADYDCKSRGFRLELQLRKIVQDINRNAADFESFGLRQLLCPRTLVDVAAYGGDGSNCGELIDYLGGTDIPGMNDVIRLAQNLKCFRAQQSVRIGDDADQDGAPEVQV